MPKATGKDLSILDQAKLRLTTLYGVYFLA